MKRDHSVQARLRKYLQDNPDATVSQADVVRLFGCARGTANSAMYNLMRYGTPKGRFRIRHRGPTPAAGAAFPLSLTVCERRVVEAYAEFGSCKGVARVLDISPFTVGDHLKKAREKADVHETVVLVAKYLKATLVPEAA